MISMYLVQIVVPTRTKDGEPISEEGFARTRAELTEKFGGVEAYHRAQARGVWKSDDAVQRDDLIIFEVMTQDLERRWWAEYRVILEGRFGQDGIVIRAMWAERL